MTVFAGAVLTAACASNSAPGGRSGSTGSLRLSTTTVSSEATVRPSEPVNPALQAQIDSAVSDLSGRLRVDASAISVVSAQSTVWPDRSLGCPQPGMVYPQVQVDGVLIVLSAQGTDYRYHSGGSRGPFLCEN